MATSHNKQKLRKKSLIRWLESDDENREPEHCFASGFNKGWNEARSQSFENNQEKFDILSEALEKMDKLPVDLFKRFQKVIRHHGRNN